MLLVKVPDPVPSSVLLLAIVGLWSLLQQTPLKVIDPPPSDIILPPVAAEFWVIELTAAVVREAVRTGLVANVTSGP
jgi:hypothetical protein